MRRKASFVASVTAEFSAAVPTSKAVEKEGKASANNTKRF